MAAPIWWQEVESILERKSLLKHPFYQAWQAGHLTRDDLKAYATAYYPHVAAFPRYVSATHSATESLPMRQMLLENLVEEERGPENHPELWLRFAEGLGATRSEVTDVEPAAKTLECIGTFRRLSEDGLRGLAALYAYESQIPAVSRTKIEGLEKFYGVTDAEPLKFFKVHEQADVWHSEEERKALWESAKTPAQQKAVVASVNEACDAVWSLLDHVCDVRGISCN